MLTELAVFSLWTTEKRRRMCFRRSKIPHWDAVRLVVERQKSPSAFWTFLFLDFWRIFRIYPVASNSFQVAYHAFGGFLVLTLSLC